jgi:preprotein translocase subunit Sec63
MTSTSSSYSSKPQRTQSNQDQQQQQSKPSRKASFDPSNEKDDLYHILEVEREVNVDDLKKSYRKLALRYHPDKTAGDPESTERVEFTFLLSLALSLSD